MKKIYFIMLIVFSLVACGGGGDDSGNSGPQIQELSLDETTTGDISQKGEVDWYRFNAVEVNSTLSVSCQGSYNNSPVDFMMTIYEKDENGQYVTIFGESAKEDVFAPADLNIKVAINEPRELYIAVRDFKDDDASPEGQRIPYRLTASYSGEAEDNNTFASAMDLPVGAGQTCLTESIFPVMDVDCYRFAIADGAGVYRITASFDLDDDTHMPVNLGIELYDGEGQLVQEFKGQRPVDNTYLLLPYLENGEYFMVVKDQGSDDESQYDYSICIEPVAATEIVANDTTATAEERTPGPDGYTLDGTLEYVQDEDWYVLDVPTTSGNSSQNIRINFFQAFGQVPESLRSQVSPAGYRITVRDGSNNVIHSYDLSVIVAEPYQVEIAAGSGEQNYVVVQPLFNDQMLVAMPYQLNIQIIEVSDEGESPDGQETARVLNPDGETVTGKIFKLGDVDNYQITVDTTNTTGGPRVLEIYFDTTEQSEVAYTVNVTWDGKHRVLKDINGFENGADEGAHFKTSYFLPETTGTGTTINLEVSDDQGNDGSDVTYTLKVNVLEIPSGLPALEDAAGVVSNPVYFDEPGEKLDTTATNITVVEYYNENQPDFESNSTMLDVMAAEMAGNTWQSDWIAGFVDYDGDRDIFELNFNDIVGPDVEGAPEDWYFDIQVHMFAPASDVEYSWTLFRDRQPNEVLVERTFWENADAEDFEYDPNGEGIIASWADMEITQENHNVIIPSTQDAAYDHPLWVGDEWAQSRFYISINDFNRAVESRTLDELTEAYIPTPNQIPDNDWGNTNSDPVVRPYYFQVSVTFHPGCSSPDDEECAN